MTEGLLCLFVMPASLFVIPPVLSVMPAGPLCHARRPLSVMPPGLFVMPAGLSLSYRRPPLSFPPAPLCHSRRLLAGIQYLALLFLYSYGPCMGEDLDSRLKTLDRNRRGQALGMTEGGLKAGGMTEGMLCLFVIPASPLCHAAGPLCHARRPLSVMPPGTLCHARRPPLSFPPVSPITNVGDKVSGNPASCFVVVLFVWACMGEDLDSRLKMSGMTEEDYQPSIETVEGRLWA